MTKRGNGEGTIYKRKDGRWEASYFLDTPEGPKKRSIYGKTRKAVAERLAGAIADRDRGLIFDAKGATVEEFLRRWLEDAVRPGTAHRTYAAHRQQVETHVIPALGRLKLSALRKHHVDRLYANLLREEPNGPGLAPSTVRRVHAVLHRALEEAVKGDLIFRNPAAHANKPMVSQKEIKPLDAKQAKALLDAAMRSGYEALYAVCLLCGLRQGEALGLRWSDVDLDAGALLVQRQLQRRRGEGGEPGRLEFSEPKNASRRTVELPQRALRALSEHRKRQREEKFAAGPFYEDQGLVFASRYGRPLDAQNVVNRHFKPLLKRAGLPPIRFHDLRHSCLSLLAQRGEPLRDLQALAGHANAGFTMQRYTHHYRASAGRTARAMDDILPDGEEPTEDGEETP